MSHDLLLEIGAEEIPAGFLARAIAEAPAIAKAKLAAARLEHGEIVALGAPRRLAIFVPGLADRQPDIAETVTGPPVSAAYDKDGKPTRAAAGFAAKNGIPVEALTVAEVPGKGKYIAARREQKGEETRALLPKLLVDIIRAIPWKKSMRWATGGPGPASPAGGRSPLTDEAFVRPVHWIVALYGGEVVALEIYGVTSGRETHGHRFLAPGAIALEGSLHDYQHKLRAAFVIVDPASRRTAIEAELRRIERDAGVKIRSDEDLLAEVTNLVEYPHAICGDFEPRHLEIPAEVIVSAMRGHQRYFATESEGGALAPHFVTIAGTLVKDPKVVQHGNERVLAARLADARFFFDEDRAHKLEERAGKLGGIAFIKGLGTMADKVARIVSANPLTATPGEHYRRAAHLCKVDLLTKMVGEFPDLQGVMGREYAIREGEPTEVADAIFEHYLPRNAADRLPVGAIGASLGVADRMDTIVGCFSLGLAPTGSNDPYGLRRAALAVLNILIQRAEIHPPGLDVLVNAAAAELRRTIHVRVECEREVLDFFRGRLRGLLTENRSLPVDCVEAALSAGFHDVPDTLRRATAMAHLRDRPDFEPLAITFKRVANILKGEISNELYTGLHEGAHDSEKALLASYLQVASSVTDLVGKNDYDAALRELAGLKPAVDKFFDDVLVMDPDPTVRANRLNLLGTINATFMKIADFRQLAVK